MVIHILFDILIVVVKDLPSK